MQKKYIVTLMDEERQMLQAMLSRGKAAARKLVHARILLKADASSSGPGWDGVDKTVSNSEMYSGFQHEYGG